MQVYRFLTVLRCHLANGDTDTLTGFEVAIEAANKAEARALVGQVAADMVHDGGSHLLDAPLDHLDVVRVVSI